MIIDGLDRFWHEVRLSQNIEEKMIVNMPVYFYFLPEMVNEKGEKLSAPMQSSGLKFKI